MTQHHVRIARVLGAVALVLVGALIALAPGPLPPHDRRELAGMLALLGFAVFPV